MRRAIVERLERLERPVVVVAALERETALSGRGHHLERLERSRVVGLDPEAREPRRRQDGGVDLAVGEFAEPRVDVPAERRDGQAGERGQQLGPSAEARRADHRVGLQSLRPG